MFTTGGGVAAGLPYLQSLVNRHTSSVFRPNEPPELNFLDTKPAVLRNLIPAFYALSQIVGGSMTCLRFRSLDSGFLLDDVTNIPSDLEITQYRFNGTMSGFIRTDLPEGSRFFEQVRAGHDGFIFADDVWDDYRAVGSRLIELHGVERHTELTPPDYRASVHVYNELIRAIARI